MPLPESPTVGVVVISYNNRPFLSTCLDSVLQQTYTPEQVVVCDDASTDGSRDVIRKYENRHPEQVTAVLHEANGGIAANLNSGLRRIETDLVSLISGDDKWAPEKIEHEVKALQNHPKARWAYSACRNLDPDGNDIGPFEREHDGAEGKILYDILTHKMTLRNWVAERSLTEEVGFFDDSLEIFEDWDYKIRLSAQAPVTSVSEETVFYRRTEGSASSSSSDVYARNLEAVYEKHEDLINVLPTNEKRNVLEIKRQDLCEHYRGAFHHAMNSKKIVEAFWRYVKSVQYSARPQIRMGIKMVIYPILQLVGVR
jgi:glycosyltransferase involved in cell wall biosynthesis